MLDPHHFNMDPDQHQSGTEYESDTIGLQSTDPPRLHFEPPQHPGFHSNADPDSSPAKILRIRIRKPGYIMPIKWD